MFIISIFCKLSVWIIYNMKNIEYVYIFIIGFGYCLLYVFFYIMFGLYYDKYRSLVMGVVIVGFGFGGIVFFNLV